MSAARDSQQPGEQLEVVAGRYALIKLVARGGMAEVHVAQDRSTGRTVALKRLHEYAREQRALVVHFMREYHVLAELCHPRIIAVYDYGVDRDVPYYTMELLDGHDLRELSPMPYREACACLRDVASSLALLHARRLLHRDVSPRNVRRTSDGRCKLIDFGAMIPFGLPPNVAGTAPFLAPETLQGGALDQRADLYSLGALAYWLLTGKNGRAVSEIGQLVDVWRMPLKPPRQLVQEIPVELDELVLSLMSLDPMKRPKSAAEVIDWLSAVGELPTDEGSADLAARSFLITSRLCGRDGERTRLADQLERALDGHGSAALVEGPTGTGKTRMLNEAALIGQTLGLTVVRATARRQRGADYPVARDLVASLLQIAPAEAESGGASCIEWPSQLLPRVHESRSIGDASELRGRLQQALMSLFATVAQQRPLLLTVDDLDSADEFRWRCWRWRLVTRRCGFSTQRCDSSAARGPGRSRDCRTRGVDVWHGAEHRQVGGLDVLCRSRQSKMDGRARGASVGARHRALCRRNMGATKR